MIQIISGINNLFINLVKARFFLLIIINIFFNIIYFRKNYEYKNKISVLKRNKKVVYDKKQIFSLTRNNLVKIDGF